MNPWLYKCFLGGPVVFGSAIWLTLNPQLSPGQVTAILVICIAGLFLSTALLLSDPALSGQKQSTRGRQERPAQSHLKKQAGESTSPIPQQHKKPILHEKGSAA